MQTKNALEGLEREILSKLCSIFSVTVILEYDLFFVLFLDLKY